MIINNTYFKNELYIPHAKPGLNDEITSVQSDVDSYIDKYSRECLLKSLGYQLFQEFTAELDPSEANGLKPTADAKWDELLNGTSYTDSNGVAKVWRGIRFKSSLLDGAEYDTSFLAGYVYFYFQKNGFDTTTNVGTVKESAVNAEFSSPAPKAVSAWNDFIELAQGKTNNPNVWIAWNGTLAVDYYGDGFDIFLYQFINDSNELIADRYEGFNPYCWKPMTQFGI
tara:strand:+ start:194 stop:871 length:678 start_codon:yes stop_codon:yes gene_type:complete